MAAIATATMQEAEVSRTFRRLTLKSRKSSTTSAASNKDQDPDNIIRRPSAQDQKRKTSLASISSRFRLSRKSIYDNEAVDLSNRLGELFLGLPAEIQADILSFLTTKDFLALRLSCKGILNIVQSNPNTLSRTALQQSELGEDVATTILQLYPYRISRQHDEPFFLVMLHREKTVQRQLRVILEFMQTRVYMMKLHIELPCKSFAPYRNALRRRMYAPMWIINHLLDSIRNVIVNEHRSHSHFPNKISTCPDCMTQIKQIVSKYPSSLLLHAYHILHLILQQLCSATRAPQFVGAFERRLRGWRTGSPPDEELSQLTFLGGLEEICKINEMEGSYGKRMMYVNSFRDKVTEAVRVNELAFPSVAFESDPVLSQVSTRSSAAVSEVDVTKAHESFLTVLTTSILSSVPETEKFLVGSGSIMADRLLAEGLIEREEELQNPYPYVKRLMAECYDAGEVEAAPGRSGSVQHQSQHVLDGGTESSDESLVGIEAEF